MVRRVSMLIIILLLGLLASVSPSTLVVFILLLATTRPRLNAAAFLIGWSISLVVVFAVSYAVGGARVTQHGSGRTVVQVIEILLGVVLAVVAVRQWGHRDRPRASSGRTSKFTSRLKELKPVGAATVGVLEQPWTLTAAAAVVVVRHQAALPVVIFAFLAFTVLSTATVGLIFLYYARRPGQAEARLSDLRDRLVRAGPALLAIVSLAVGVFLIIDGAIGIATG
jgi:hypothetical protein